MQEYPSVSYRSRLREGLVMLAPPEAEALLMGKGWSEATMDELEIIYRLVFNADPLDHAPAGYAPTVRAEG